MNQNELNQLIPLLQNFNPAPNWSFRSLSTVFHSFTSAGVFKPQKHTDQAVKDIQAALLVAYLDAVTHKCNQRPLANDIDARGIANLLWALAKLEELIKIGVLVSISVSLVYELGEYGQFTQQQLTQQQFTQQQFTQQQLLMILWGLLPCSARLYFDGNADGNGMLQQSINKLFTDVQKERIDRTRDG